MLLSRTITLRHLVLFAVEDGIILLALLAAMAIRFQGAMPEVLGASNEWLRIAIVVGVTQMSLYYHDLYELRVLNSRRELFIGLLQALGVASIALAVVYYLYPGLILGRGVFALFVGILLAVVVVWRLAYTAVLSSRGLSVQLLLVGGGALARQIYGETRQRKTLGFQVVGCLVADPEAGAAEGLPPVLGGFSDLPKLAESGEVDRYVVAISERRGRFPVRELMELRIAGNRVDDGCQFYEELTGKMLVEHLRPSQLIFGEGFAKSRSTVALKRFVDFAASAVGLILSAPVWLVVPFLIKVDSKGPVFYCQERVGAQGRPFQVLKFRSMSEDAEQHSGAVWAQAGDARVTRVGKVMRKTRIDEIPQLLNVLKGEMSFVGPRPERPVFVQQLADEIPYYLQRHSVKPGVTGLAQVKYPYGATVADAGEKLRVDLYYLKKMGLWMDLSIIFETVKVVLFGKGAR